MHGPRVAALIIGAASILLSDPAKSQGLLSLKIRVRGHREDFFVDFSHKAVERGPLRLNEDAGGGGFSAAYSDDYRSMGVDLHRRASERDFGRGLPVRFAGGGVGLLTNAILIGTDTPQNLEYTLGQAIRTELVVGATDILRVEFSSPEEALKAISAIENVPGVRFAHPDFRLQVEARGRLDPTQEPLSSQEWHMERLGMAAAWKVTTGSPTVLVALIDLGFEVDHPDLKDAWAVNPREIPANRKDDDGNGLVDDVLGWNFGVRGPNLLFGAGPGHGTATAGIIGARVNGLGGSGLCPECRILPLVIDDQISSAVSAFLYAKSMGATVVSNSWGYRVGTPETEALMEAIQRLAEGGRNGRGTSIVFAMGNKGRDDCRGREPDISALPSVIAVSSADQNDLKISYAGYGPCLAILAPSSDSRANGILTTDRKGAKGFNTGSEAGDLADFDYTNSFHGTSAAAPQVAGALALLYAACPDLTSSQAFEILTRSADKVHSDLAQYNAQTGRSLDYGFGRLNVGAMLEEAVYLSATDRCTITENKKDSTN